MSHIPSAWPPTIITHSRWLRRPQIDKSVCTHTMRWWVSERTGGQIVLQIFTDAIPSVATKSILVHLRTLPMTFFKYLPGTIMPKAHPKVNRLKTFAWGLIATHGTIVVISTDRTGILPRPVRCKSRPTFVEESAFNFRHCNSYWGNGLWVRRGIPCHGLSCSSIFFQ